jgi:predicted phage terminase large subunit-like protein
MIAAEVALPLDQQLMQYAIDRLAAAAGLEDVRPDRVHDPQTDRSLAAYAKAAWPLIEPGTTLVWGWHLDAVCEHLEAVTDGEIRNLLITIPPRSGKSTLTSVMWPTWSWIKRPEMRWLFASYAQTLSTRDALRSRRIIQSAWYQERWGHVYRLTGDQNQKMRYENDRQGFRIASSVGGSNTGEGADCLVADDAHNLAEIHSETVRQGVLTWWDEVMSSRLNDPKTGAKVIIMQRAHEADLAGHVLDQGGYQHLNLPMEYEPTTYSFHGHVVDPRTELGELLCPDRIGAKENEDLKVRLGSAAYSGQYGQKPTPAGGGLFKEWWWRYWCPADQPMPPVMVKNAEGEHVAIAPIPLPEQFEELIQSWDMAFKDLKTSDFVAGGVWGRLGSRKFLLDLSYGRMDFVKTCTAVQELSAKWPRAVAKLVEDKANGTAVMNSLRGKVSGLIAVEPEGSKFARASAVSPEVEAGDVFLPHPLLFPWVQPFIHEHTMFPNGAHDDRVDHTSQALARWIGRRQRFLPIGI